MTLERRRSWAVILAGGVWGTLVCLQAFAWPEPFPPLVFDRPVSPAPYFASAALRATRSMGGLVLVLGAAWQIGRWVTARASDLFETAAEHLHITLAVGLATMSATLFALAAVGAYRRPVVIVFLVAAALSRPAENWRALRRFAGHWRDLVPAHRSVVDLVYVACSVAAIAFAFVAALAPEIEYDALYYHLWLPKQWLAAGRPIDIVEEYIALYPLGWELLYGAAMAAGGAGAAKLVHFVCLPLSGWAAVLVARHVAPSVSMPLVFALVVTAPTLIWEAGTAYVDLALGWLLALTSFALLRFHQRRDRRWLLIGGVTMGMALSVKHLALVALAIFAVLLSWPAPGRGLSGGIRVRVVAMFLAAALALAIPWYARAWAASHNPVFPEMYGVFGAQPPERWSAKTEFDLDGFKATFGMGRTAGALLRLPWDLATRPAPFGGDLGPLIFILVPLAACAAERRRLIAAALGVLAYVAVWASPLSSFQLRFLVPIVPLLAVLGASGASALTQSADRVRRGWQVVPALAIAMLLVLNLPPFMPWHGGRPRTSINHVPVRLPAAVVLGAESSEAYLDRTIPTYRAWQYINTHTPTEARVLAFAGGDHYYSERRRLWSNAALARPATFDAVAGNEAHAMRAVRALGLTHLLIDRRVAAIDSIDRLALLSARVRQCCLVPLYEDGRASVYEIRPDAYQSTTWPDRARPDW